jgi:phospholipid/cholesterol/gamma-HCH transport system ATP-binding protein
LVAAGSSSPASAAAAALALANPAATSTASAAIVQVQGLTVAHGRQIVQHDLDFAVQRGEIFAIVGVSGSGKSSLMRDLVGLQAPAAGRVWIDGHDLYASPPETLQKLRRRMGVMFQTGALWSGMTVGDNLLLPLRLFTSLPPAAQAQRARLKLALVGLDGAFGLMPAALSGGMAKRAALARALVLDPELLFLDEPGSGLDPVNAERLHGLILQLRAQLGTTVVMVTHEIHSVMTVADRMLFLDEVDQTMTALGTPQALLAHGPERVRAFLQLGSVPSARPARP